MYIYIIWIYMWMWMCMCICIRGRGLRFPEHRGTLSLAIQQHMCDLLIYRRGRRGIWTSFELRSSKDVVMLICVVAYRRGWGCINVLWSALGQRCCFSSFWHTDGGVLWTALEERCCDSEDVVTLKMLLCWRCCFVEIVENVATLKMFFLWTCWRCCYVEDVVALRMLLRWRFFYIENVADVVMLEKGDVHFALGSLGKYDIFIGTQFSWFLQKQPKMKNWKNLILIKTADNISQACCPRVEVVQCVIMFHEDHQTL